MDYKELLDEYDLRDELMMVDDVAEFLHCNKNMVYRLIQAGKLPYIKVGCIKVLRSSLLKMIKKYENCDITDPENIVFIGTDV